MVYFWNHLDCYIKNIVIDISSSAVTTDYTTINDRGAFVEHTIAYANKGDKR